MKHVGKFLVVLAVALLLTGCSPGESPEDGAREWIDAIVNQDGNRMLKHTCVAQRESLQEASMWFSAFSVLAQLFTNRSVQIEGDVSDLKFETVSRSGDRAEVRVYGELRVAVLGSAQAQQVDERWTMIRENDTWRWCGSKTGALPVVPGSTLEPASVTVEINATSLWQDTGVSVHPGQQIEITATGTWSHGLGDPVQPNPYGPDGTDKLDALALLPTVPEGALIGRIGTGEPFLVGSQKLLIAQTEGQMQLSINDSPAVNDNIGSILVTITMK